MAYKMCLEFQVVKIRTLCNDSSVCFLFRNLKVRVPQFLKGQVKKQG